MQDQVLVMPLINGMYIDYVLNFWNIFWLLVKDFSSIKYVHYLWTAKRDL